MSRSTAYRQFVSRLTAAHTLIIRNGTQMDIIDQDDRAPHIIDLCASILVEWYEHSAVEESELVECICEDMRTAISDMLYAREQENRANALLLGAIQE
jgi:hypothetical protein